MADQAKKEFLFSSGGAGPPSGPDAGRVWRYRDLSLLPIDPSRFLVIACDSSGGIGPKSGDVVQVPAYIVGRFGVRVPLMEVLAVGAEPVGVIDTLAVEPEPTGAEIKRGIADELVSQGLKSDLIINGSTEKNVPTIQTGLGITVLGLVKKKQMLWGRLEPGQIMVCLGRPKVGPEVSLDDPEIADLGLVGELARSGLVTEVVPVGSRGVRGEAEELARLYGCEIHWSQKEAGGGAWSSAPHQLRSEHFGVLDLEKSAGPATCLLAAGRRRDLLPLVQKLGKPFWVLGELVAGSQTPQESVPGWALR